MTQCFMATDVGCVRPLNEDRVLALPDKNVYAVADGMGGEAAGEVASALLVETLRTTLPHYVSFEWELKHAILAANDRILQKARSEGLNGMGTTATVLHVGLDGYAHWAHVGDSRLYLLRGDSLIQITEDHSYVWGLVKEGSITKDEARRHPKKNYLLRAVGVEERLEVDMGYFPLESGDVLLLSTDGLMNMVAEEDVFKRLFRLREEGFREDAARSLISMALAEGGADNVSAVVVVYAHE